VPTILGRPITKRLDLVKEGTIRENREINGIWTDSMIFGFLRKEKDQIRGINIGLDR